MSTRMTDKEKRKLTNLQNIATSPVSKKSQAKTYENLVEKKISETIGRMKKQGCSPYEIQESIESIIKGAYVYANVNGIELKNLGNTFKGLTNKRFVDGKWAEPILDEKRLEAIKTQYSVSRKPTKYSIFKGVRERQTVQVKAEIKDVIDLRERASRRELSKEEVIRLYRQEIASPNPRRAVLLELNLIGGSLDKKLDDVLETRNLPAKKKAREAEVAKRLSDLRHYEDGILGMSKEGQLAQYGTEFGDMSDEQKKSPVGEHLQGKMDRLKAQIDAENERKAEEREARRDAAIKKQIAEEKLAAEQKRRDYLDQKAKYEAEAPERARQAAIRTNQIGAKMDWRGRESTNPSNIHPHSDEIQNA